MRREPLSSSIFAQLLQKCVQSKALSPGKQIHASTLIAGDIHAVSLNQKLVVLYASCGELSSARLLFYRTKRHTIFTINWMILSSAFCGNSEEPFAFFSYIRRSKTSPNPHTFMGILKACTGLMGLKETQQVHSLVNRQGFLPTISVVNSLIDAYCKCGGLTYGRRVFDEMHARDVASWTSIISGYSAAGDLHSSSLLFEKMRGQGLRPNEFTWNAVIVGRARTGDIDGTRSLLSEMAAEGVACDVVTWNAVVSGFAQGGRPSHALEAFSVMRENGIAPNYVTIAGLLPALTSMGSVHVGKEVHCLVLRTSLHANVFVSCALVDMYSKCGSPRHADAVFSLSSVRNTALWNSIIGCWGSHGRADAAVQLFRRMRREGGVPNETTLTCVLSACSHGGMADEGLGILEWVRESGVIELKELHYGCVVDLLCRSGRMEEAYALVRDMDGTGDVAGSVAGAFMNGCNIHGRKDMAVEGVAGLGKKTLTVEGLVALSNMHAANEEWGDVARTRLVIKDEMIKKNAGFSRVDYK